MKFRRVGLYVRVSTDIQVDGYSIDEQIERLRKYCEAHGWTIYAEYVDPGFTGSNIDRPGLLKMLKDVREKKLDLVLVYKLDRLSRSQKDTLYLIEEEFLPNNVDFISMSENFDTSTPFGKAMIGILSVFAQLEREQIKERLAMGHLGRAKAGYWRGGSNAPVGYDFIDGKLIINEYEALQVRKIFELFLKGESLNGIANFMSQNYTNRYSSYNTGAGQIGVMIRNTLYIGKIKFKGVEYDGVHEPIIDIDTFNLAQKRYKEISSTWSDNYRSPYKGKHLLTGLLFCGNCGARYFTWCARASKKDENGKQLKKGEKYSYYKCYTRDGNKQMKKADSCDNPTYRVEELDNVILGEIKKLKLDPEYLSSLVDSADTASEDNTVTVLREELTNVKKKIDKLMDLYTLGTIPIEDIGDKLKPLYEQKDKLEKSIAEAQKEKTSPSKLSIGEVEDILNNICDLDAEELSVKREIVQALIKRIELGTERDTLKIYWKFN
jgi:site-specific DNA recombinase